MKSGVRNIGQFEVIGKQESGHLLLECSSCTRRFEYDPIKGDENWRESGTFSDTLDHMINQIKNEKQTSSKATNK